VKTGEVGLVVDSYGLMSVTVNRGSAAAELGLAAADRIELERLGDEDDGDAGITTQVQLTRRRKA